jgi:hypothetical protein
MSATTLTFSTLLSDLESYSDRGRAGDTVVADQLPRLINTAERTIVTDLKLQGYQRVLTQALASGTSVYAKPDRWRETISFSIVDGAERRQLYGRSYEYVRAYWPNEAEAERPKFYADYSSTHWLIGPTPDQAYPAEILIYQLPALLSASNQTNWLTDEAPSLLRYRALMELNLLLKNPRWQEFQSLYAERLQSLRGEDMGKVMDRAAARDTV